MTPITSSLHPVAWMQNTTCNCFDDFCKMVHDFAMKIINAIKQCFASKTMAGPLNLISFYRGQEPNNRQATLEQILSWDDGQLEADHYYIQWLFPLATRSGYNLTAPILDAETIGTFRNDAALKNQMLRSFRKML